MSIKTRAKLILAGLAVVITAGAIGGALTHHDHYAPSTGPHVTSHNGCQAEDDPCWRSPQGRNVGGQDGHYACTDSALPCYDEWIKD